MRRAKTWTKWTPVEDTVLKQLVSERKKAAEIAKTLGRTADSVNNRKYVLRLQKPQQFPEITPLRVAEIVKFKMAGWRHCDIAKVYGISIAEISRILCENGMKGTMRTFPKYQYPRRQWSELGTHRLRECIKKGYSFDRICSYFPHRTPGAVRLKIWKITRYWLTPEQQEARGRAKEKEWQWRVY